MQAYSMLLDRPWQYDIDLLHHGKTKDELAWASKLKNQEHAKSENQICGRRTWEA